MNDADIAMAEATAAANHAEATRKRRPFDPERDGPTLAEAVREAVIYFCPIFETITVVADDNGFAHDDAATSFAFDVAQKTKAELEREEQQWRK